MNNTASAWAIRCSLAALLVAGWILASGLLYPAVASVALGLGVIFADPIIIVVNCGFGAAAFVFTAARAWNHQAAGLSWTAAILGLGVAAAPVLSGAPGIATVHNVVLGLLLAALSTAAAVWITGPLTAAPAVTWGGHVVPPGDRKD